MNEADFQDELWSPFPTAGSSYNFIDFNEFPILSSESDAEYEEYEKNARLANENDYRVNPLNFKITLFLSSQFTVQSRMRYNVWDLLGDVGGFNDGLVLVSSILFSFIS